MSTAVPPAPAQLHGQAEAGRRAVIYSASIGAGHNGAAREIASVLSGLGYAVTQVEFLDVMPGRTGRWLARAYALQLRAVPRSWGMLLRVLSCRPLAALAAWLAAVATKRRIAATLSGAESVVVSTYPLASQALGRLRTTGQLTAPVITFLCDLSVHRLWIADGVDGHIAIHPLSQVQAVALGAREVAVCAPAVNPVFRPLDPAERAAARIRWGLPAGPIALVVGGSGGTGSLARTAREVAASGVATPVTVCGHNTRLRRQLVQAGIGVPLGWVSDMASLIGAVDVVVENAGGLTSREAAAAGVPVVIYRPLSGHGVANAGMLREAGLVAWPRTRQAFVAALNDVITAPPVDVCASAPSVADHLRSVLAPEPVTFRVPVQRALAPVPLGSGVTGLRA